MSASMLSIAAVERDTGLSKDLLRVWERRYGFPMPQRDPAGERAYPLAQVARLRLVKRLLDGGHRPGRVLPLADTALQALAVADQRGAEPRAANGAASAAADLLPPLLALLHCHDLVALRAHLQGRLQQLGLHDFVLQFAAPLHNAVADAWLHGQLQTFEQRACLQALQDVLRAGIEAVPVVDKDTDTNTDTDTVPQPRVLLTTLPGEPQTMRLQLAEALLAQAGCDCIALGAQLPAADTAQAVAAYGADIVALGSGDTLGANAAVHGLTELRALLPEGTALWAGGAGRMLQRRRVAGVQPLSLHELLPELARWRGRRAAGQAAAGASRAAHA